MRFTEVENSAHRAFRSESAFTLIELLVAMAILALLLSITAPRYFDSVSRAKEAALHANLSLLRDSIDKYRADLGVYPPSLQALVDGKYIRSVPVDPVTDTSASWVLVSHPDGVTRGAYDVRSGAVGLGRDNTAFETW